MNSKVSESKRIEYIDSLKGFAIILVVLGHVTDGYFFSRFNPAADDIFWPICNVIYAFHMPLMMLISGYLFFAAYIKRDAEKNVTVKWKRLLIHILNMIFIYIVFSLVFGFIKMKLAGVVTDSVTADDLKGIFVKSISPFWYLYVLIAFSVVTPFIIKLAAMSSIPKGLNPTFPVVILGLVLNIYANIELTINDNRFELYRLCYFYIFFAAGLLVRSLDGGAARSRDDGEKAREDGASEKRAVPTAVICIISLILMAGGIAIIAYLWDDVLKIYTYTVPHFNTLAAALISASIWLTARYIIPAAKVKWLAVPGRYTLEIYVTHTLFTSFIRHIFVKLGYREPISCILINTAVTLAVIMLAIYVTDKIKIRDIVFRPFKKIGS